MSSSEPCTPGDRGASPAGTEDFRSAGLCTDPGAGIPFSSVAACHSIISEEQTTQLLLSLCHHFPSHTHRMSTWRLTSNSGSRRGAQEGVAAACSAWGVRTGPCRQADRKIDRRPWDPLTPLSTSRLGQQFSHLLGSLFAHLGAGVVLASPCL